MLDQVGVTTEYSSYTQCDNDRDEGYGKFEWAHVAEVLVVGLDYLL